METPESRTARIEEGIDHIKDAVKDMKAQVKELKDDRHDIRKALQSHGFQITTLVADQTELKRLVENNTSMISANTAMISDMQKAFVEGTTVIRTLLALGKGLAWFSGICVGVLTIQKLIWG